MYNYVYKNVFVFMEINMKFGNGSATKEKTLWQINLILLKTI